MIVNVKRKELLSLAKKVGRAAPVGDLGENRGMLIEADGHTGILRMTATDFDIAIQASFPAAVDMGGNAVIDAKLFLDILSLMPGENLYMELRRGTQLFIQSEASEFHIAVLPGDKYPKVDIPYPDETVLVSGLKSLIGASAFAVADTKDPVFGCVNLVLGPEGLSAVAGSNFGIARVQGDKDCTGQISLLIPVSSMKTLAALSRDSDVYEMGVTGAGPKGKNVVFFDGTMTFAARLIDGQYVDIGKVFDSFQPLGTANINADKLKNALDNATTAAKTDDVVRLSFANGGLLIDCETKQGNASIAVEARITRHAAEAFHYSAQRLMNCVRTLAGEIELSLSTQGNLLIRNDKMMYLQAPVRVAKTEKQAA